MSWFQVLGRNAGKAVFLLAIPLLFIFLTSCGGSSSGGGGDSAQPPSGLTYPQTSIKATVGAAISQDTPTVSGTVTGYAVSPALPAGLALNATTGMISGTPTAQTTQATYTVTASNSAGSTTAALTIAVALPAPSNLVYPQTSIVATAGVYVPPDTPTVTGSVTGYSISPALPEGLVCNTGTGAISGTPGVLSPQTNYTVTASNSAGSATAVVTITVVPQAPANLVYPQTTIIATAGIPISADVPEVSGTVTSFSSSPALPAGLTLDQGTGTIAGTPTAATPKTTYTISASNVGGSATAQVTITVAASPTVLLELGHGATVSGVELASDRLLSLDVSGHWVLWDYSTAKILASGDGATGLVGNPNQAPLTGQFFAVSTATQIQLYSITDGHSIASIPFAVAQGQGWSQIASDGSYVCTGTASGLTVWTPDGQSELTVAGDYHAASPYAAPAQVQIANGPSGASVIQTISVPSGASSTGPQFSGAFSSWFLDGTSFFTSLSNVVWIYSTAGTQEALLSPASTQGLMGNGNLYWVVGGGVSVYSVSSGNLIQTYPSGLTSYVPSVWSSGTTVAILFSTTNANVQQFEIVDLSGPTPTATTQPGPGITQSDPLLAWQWDSLLPVFAWQNSQAWVLAGPMLVDGPSLSNTSPRYFGYGRPSGIAAASNVVALSTATGFHFLDPSTATDIGDFGNTGGFGDFGGFVTGDMALSTDGSVLAANGTLGMDPATPMLNVYSLSSMSMIGTFSYPTSGLTYPFVSSFALSGSGTVLGQVIGGGEPSAELYTQQVTGVSGTPVIWNGFGSGSLALSPDGTLIGAVSGALPTQGGSVGGDTEIYQNATLLTAIPAYALGWIDNNDLLAGNYVSAKYPGATYVTSTIYSASGQTLFTFPSNTLPEIVTPEFTGANSVYDPRSNAVYSLADGSNLWQGPTLSPPSGAPYGALAGNYVVYIYGHQVLLAQY